MPQSSVWCNPAEVLTLKPDAEQWLCDKPFNSTAVAENTRCFLKCNNKFEVFQGEFTLTSSSYYTCIDVYVTFQCIKICIYLSTFL